MVKLHKLSPILRVTDLAATIQFYESVLGFTAQSNFPNFASLTREGVEIMVIVPQEDPAEGDHPQQIFQNPVFTGSLFIITERVDELWESVKKRATIKTSIGDREYLMRDFSILDNNGYELVFGEDISRRK